MVFYNSTNLVYFMEIRNLQMDDTWFLYVFITGGTPQDLGQNTSKYHNWG